MNYKKVFDVLRNMKFDKESISCTIPMLLTFLWGLFSILSIPVMKIEYLLNGFVLSSILIKIITAFFIFYFFIEFYVKNNTSNKLFKKYQSFTGYGIVITYVFYSFPRMVAEYYDRASNFNYIVADFIIILIITALPTVVYLFLRSDKTRLMLKTYDKQMLDFEKKMKKDKLLKKKEIKKIRAERTFLQNIWYDWVDIILQAILIVMLINQFLFQMYAIPSESMVPTFLKKDMVIVNKLIYGPQIPLTEWKLFSPFKPKSGDIVVFLNPETYNKESDVSYKNLFARIFQPFLYRLTFTKVDIDLKENGQPKERFIVKRKIAGGNEKICILNNKVYKKKPDSSWQLMSKIKNEKEWGEADLYLEEVQGMEQQLINKEIRNLLNKAEELISSHEDADLKALIEYEAGLLKTKLEKTDINTLKEKISLFLSNNRRIVSDNDRKLLESYSILSNIHYHRHPQIDITKVETEYRYALNNYKFSALYKSAVRLYDEFFVFNADRMSELLKKLSTDIVRSDYDSPYKEFMKTANAFDKLTMLRLANLIIDNIDKPENMLNSQSASDNYYLSLYFDGIGSSFLSFFELSNLPDYPYEDGKYIEKNQYLFLGDNRYNSLDSRFGNSMTHKVINIDDDDIGLFSRKAVVSWDVHTVDDKFVLGKALAIYFPFNRMRLF